MKTLRHVIFALGAVMLAGVVAVALLAALNLLLPKDIGAQWMRKGEAILALAVPAITAILAFWWRRRESGPVAVRPVWLIEFLLSMPVAAIVCMISGLTVWAWLPAESTESGPGSQLAVLLLVFAGALPASVVLWLGWHSRRKALMAVALSACLVLLWLIWDEPASATPLKVAVLAPPPPRAKESHELATWAPPGWGAGAPKPWHEPALDYVARELKPAEWRVFVVANREAIRADWAAAAASREWITRLDAFEVVGDLTESNASPQMKWRLIRDALFQHCAYASLLATEGRASEAVEILRPALAVSRKLQPAARTFVRFGSGIICQRMCQNAVRFVLPTSSPAAAALQKLAAVLAPPSDLAASFQQLLLCECALNIEYYIRDVNTVVGKGPYLPFYNHNATANRAARVYRELVEVLKEGRGEGFRAHEQAAQKKLHTRAIKNVFGQMLLARSMTEFHKLVSFAHTTDDQRRALLAEVKAKIAEAEKKEATAQPSQPPTAK